MLLGVPNFSEGRDPARIAGLRAVLSERCAVLDRHSDREHNRTVFTVAGEPADLARALSDSADFAAAKVDMRRHRGLHPCIGALDVCPVVWLRPEERKEAFDTAFSVADEIGRLGIPVFLYGELAADERRRERAHFRRGGIEALAARMESGELRPDRGPDRPHSRAGATLVTARPPLAAFNLELEGVDLEEGREIAGALREAGGGLPGVRAIALLLESGRVQISTNIHDPFEVPLARLLGEVWDLARPRGGRVVVCELLGLVPEAALIDFPVDLPVVGEPLERQTIENRLG